MQDNNTIDKAGEAYWTKVWSETKLPEPIDVHSGNINHFPYRRMHLFFKELFNRYDPKGRTILEIGCGNSVFLSYFAKEFGLKPAGLDYSELGCEQTRRILQRDGLDGQIFLADAFAPGEELKEKFDFVVSLGVVEHFEDTAKAIEAFSRFVKPGGVLITTVPNLSGVTGWLQKNMNKPVYDIHVPMDKAYLERAIEKAGLKLILSRYFVSISFAVTLEGIDGKTIPNLGLKKTVLKIFRYFSKIVWMAERVFGPLPERRLFSAGILTAAVKEK